MKETPPSLKEQEENIKEYVDEMTAAIVEMSELLQTIPFDVMEHEAICEKLEEFGFDHFIDPSFPPNDSSIYDKETVDEYPLEEIPIWRRPADFMQNPKLFCDTIDPNDINQGALGNCWFLASIASVAENPALIRRLFITQEYNEKGLYQLRICKNGEWVKVTVDDYIPCYDGGGPMFCRATGDELWVLLLEKAYAKLHGSYVQLRSGFVCDGMEDLTGAPTSYHEFPKGRHDISIIEDYAEDLWKKLSHADTQNWIMCASTPGVDGFTEGGGPDEEFGIVPGHAYSLIQCKEHDGVRLMNIRNPWGEFEWGGAWSDFSEEWTEDFIDALKPDFNTEDGSFWMSYEDFFKNFESLTICKVDNWNEVRFRGIFMRVKEEAPEEVGEEEGEVEPQQDFVLSKFYYAFSLEEESEIIVGLHQEDERVPGAKLRRYVDMQVIILRRHVQGNLTIEHVSDSIMERDCETTVTLQPGHYVVIPRTCGGTMSRPVENPMDPVPFIVNYDGQERVHAFVRTTIDDVFRRLDVQLNGQLSPEEICRFGRMIDDEQISSVTAEDLASEEFKFISCDENGATNFGLQQVIKKFFSEERMAEVFEKLGYDSSLYSTKAKPIIVSFHTMSPLTVRIGDALQTDLNERAHDLLMNYYCEECLPSMQNDDVTIISKFHDRSYSFTYAAINKTEVEQGVKFILNLGVNMLTTPSMGAVNAIVPPQSLVYIGSSISDPDTETYEANYSFASKPT